MAPQQLPAMAVLLSAAASATYAFVPLGPAPRGTGRTAPTPQRAAPAARASTGPSEQTGPRGFAAAAAAASLLAAAACRQSRRRAAAGALRSPSVVVEMPAFAGASAAGQAEESQRGLVACRSLYSCYTLYFKAGKYIYKDRVRRNIRNRAYNIFMKNKYKKAMKKVLRYTVELEFGDLQPASKEEVMTELKERMDNACLAVDEVCVQGVIHRNCAARRKDRLCRAVIRGCIKKGLMEAPEDPFEPAYVTLGYTMPTYNRTRDPRPWQLPGWKSPWMLKREYDVWKYQRMAKELAAKDKAKEIAAAEAA